MDVSVDVINGGAYELRLDPDATYADVLRHVDVGVHEGTVLVDGRPVPADAPVEERQLQVLRLVAGG